MSTIIERKPEPIEEGMMWRNKFNPDDFSSELYIGTGDSVDNYDKVPVSVFEEYQKEQEEKMKSEMMLF
jgi:hypothetical protein